MIGGFESGCTQDDRSKSMNSSTFSCGVSGMSLHSMGKTARSPFMMLLT
jgi:hypothetical protein